MDCEVIILAGGRGTRLRDVLSPDLPKPLAPVAGRPFLHWQMVQLSQAGCRKVILSVGWRAERIRDAIGEDYLGMRVEYCEEQVPLGTGGAIRTALQLLRSNHAVIMNGDTYLELDFSKLLETHRKAPSSLTVCCTRVSDASRFGRLKIDGDRISGFEEKGQSGPGYINAGVYVMRSDMLAPCGEAPFSFESDFMVPHVERLAPLAFTVNGEFVDIGVPADLRRAQTLFPRT
jgi:D-glycero-alpha-D-manno-heptose 1-phosphate guanylyltransferase